MPAERAADALHARATALADEAQRLQATLDRTGAPEVHMIEARYLLARLHHDRQWLTATAQRIQARDLPWPRDQRS
jgi:histidinol-phosphate/aromatic aminotransferase/cobyric acid decarboxylase-like protein